MRCSVLIVEDIECCQADVRDFFLTDNYRCRVLCRCIARWTNRCSGCAARQRQRPSDTQHCGFRLTLSLRTPLRVPHRGDLIVGDGHRSRPCGPRLRWRYRASSDPGRLARAGLRLICRPAYSDNEKASRRSSPVTKKEPRPAVCDRGVVDLHPMRRLTGALGGATCRFDFSSSGSFPGEELEQPLHRVTA